MKRILDLQETLFATVATLGDSQDRRFTAWAKEVTAVDITKTNGYAFVGPFINRGSVEIELKPTLFIVMTCAGSMKYHTETYRVVTMDAEGHFTPTDIYTTDSKPGWALRIRDTVADLLTEINQPTASEPAAEITTPATLTRAEAHTAATQIIATLRDATVLANPPTYQHQLDLLQSFMDLLHA